MANVVTEPAKDILQVPAKNPMKESLQRQDEVEIRPTDALEEVLAPVSEFVPSTVLAIDTPSGRTSTHGHAEKHEHETSQLLESLTDQTNLLPSRKVIPILLGLAVCIVVSTLDQTLVATALPSIASHFHAGKLTIICLLYTCVLKPRYDLQNRLRLLFRPLHLPPHLDCLPAAVRTLFRHLRQEGHSLPCHGRVHGRKPCRWFLEQDHRGHHLPRYRRRGRRRDHINRTDNHVGYCQFEGSVSASCLSLFLRKR